MTGNLRSLDLGVVLLGRLAVWECENTSAWDGCCQLVISEMSGVGGACQVVWLG